MIYRIEHDGKSITFSGDIDGKAHDDLKTIAAGASVLVFNAVALDPPQAPPILYTLLTAPGDIGRLAEASDATLLLAHLSPATDQNRAEVTQSISRHYRGERRFAEDKDVITP